jgi:hypothetical protein
MTGGEAVRVDALVGTRENIFMPELPPCTCRSWTPANPCARHEILAKRILRDMDPNREYETEDDPRFQDDQMDPIPSQHHRNIP